LLESGQKGDKCPPKIELDIDIDKDIDIEEEKKEEPNSSPKTTKKFIKPSLEEVEAYCKERNNKINAEQFIDYYEANGWKVGKNSMKDWKAAVRTWERRNTTTQSTKPVRQEIVPDWLNKNVTKEEMTPDELAEMDQLLSKFKEPEKEYKPNPELQQRLKEKYRKKQSL
jgi:hypothetical protein